MAKKSQAVLKGGAVAKGDAGVKAGDAVKTSPAVKTGPASKSDTAFKNGSATAKPEVSAGRWPLYALIAGALIAVFWAYWPSMHGTFLFDDNPQLGTPEARATLLADWVHRLRPLLLITYWFNVQISGAETFSYHVLSVLIHCAAAVLMFFVTRRLFEWAGVEPRMRGPLAGFCALLFLLHPVQSEAVAYIAGRSESLSTMFFLAAFAAFLYRGDAGITWMRSAAVIALFLGALASKEQTIVLPALLLLTDYWWNPGFSLRGIRANWKLYLLMGLGAVAGVVRFLPLILNARTAGFGMKDLPWYQYLFTEFRAIFVYIREFFLPFGLNADWDFPFSRSIVDRGAIVGLIALAALIAAAWIYRRRFPLASYGFLAFLLLMSPTSSILPIRDAVAERRLYFASFGLLLVAVDLLRRIKLPRATLTAACATVLLLFTVATHLRAEVYSSELAFWQDSEAKSPDKARDHFQLANAYYNTGDCARAAAEFEKTGQYTPQGYSKYNLVVDWGEALDCAGQGDLALAKYREALSLEQTAHIYTQIAKIYGERQDWPSAMDAIDQALKIDANFAIAYAYRGIVYENTNRPADAVREYERALELDPQLEPAQQGLARARQRMQAQPPPPVTPR
jgi:tetratricopeptide (TPR) repeat protein